MKLKEISFLFMITLMITTVTLMFVAKEYALLIAILCSICTGLVTAYDKIYADKYMWPSIFVWALNTILWIFIYFTKN